MARDAGVASGDLESPILALARNWWALALRGVAAIVFGILAILWPDITLLVLVLLFAAYSIVDGVLAIAGGARSDLRRGRSWLMIAIGVIGIIAGILAFLVPVIAALALLVVIGTWAILLGVLEIVAAVRLRREIEGEWMMIVHGVIAVLFGAYILVFPGPGAIALVWLIAIESIVSGALWLMLAFRLRSWTRSEAPRGVRGRQASMHSTS